MKRPTVNSRPGSEISGESTEMISREGGRSLGRWFPVLQSLKFGVDKEVDSNVEIDWVRRRRQKFWEILI